MPKDARLYMTFPIDFPDHPKVKPLTDAAFRVFVEMNAYSRRLDLDGVIPVRVAHSMWRRAALTALVNSDAVKPLVRLTDDTYVIPDYAEHQMTKSDVEKLRSDRARAGAAGGKAKAERQQSSSKRLASATAKGKQTSSASVAESESELKLDRQTDLGDLTSPVTLVDAREEDQDAFSFASEQALTLGVKDLQRVRAVIRSALNEWVSWAETVDVARGLLELSQSHVRYPEAYIERTCANSPHEVVAVWSRMPRPELGVAS